MKPIILEMKAFGAFKDLTILDFRKFEKDKIFLIHGNMGAGKTTLFDAICASLYGVTTGMRNFKLMFSSHADESEKAFVRLVFQLEQKYYEVKRTFWIIKRRNKEDYEEEMELKTDDFADKIIFSEVKEEDGSWIPVGAPLSKSGDVNDKIVSLLGFSDKQFKQIVILPQGKFQELLHAKMDDKMEILKQLFDADLYEQVTKDLIEKAKDIEKEIDEKERIVNSTLKNIQGFIKSEEDIPNLSALERLIQIKSEALERIKEDFEKQRIESEKKQKASANLKLQHSLFQDFENAQSKLDLHLKEESSYLEKNTLLEKSQHADLFRASLNQLKKMEAALQTTSLEIAGLGEVPKALLPFLNELLAQKPSALELEGWRKEKFLLEKQKDSFELLKNLNIKITEKSNEILQKDTEISKNEESIRNLGKEIQEKTLTLAEKTAIAGKLSELTLKNEKIEQWKKIREQIQQINQKKSDLQPQLEGKKKELEISLTNLQEKSNQYLIKEALWLKSQAAILSKTLIENPGTPCPVCGSVEHPDLALHHHTEIVDHPQMERAKAEKENAQQDYDLCKEQYQALQNNQEQLDSNLEALRKNLNEEDQKVIDSEKEKFDKSLTLFNKAYQEALEAKRDVDLLEANIKAWEKEIKLLEVSLKKYGEEHTTLKLQLNDLKKDADNIQKNLPEEVKDAKDLQEKLESLEKMILRAEKINVLEGKKLEWEKTGNALLEEIKKYDFPDLDNLEKNLLPEGEIKKRSEEIAVWLSNKNKLEGSLEEAKRKTDGQQKPDPALLAQVEIEAHQSAEELNNLSKIMTREETLLDGLHKNFEQINGLEKEIQQINESSKDLIKLAELSKGENSIKQSFQAYVLSVFLDEVTIYANQRLDILSQSRFKLFRTDHKRSKQRTTGLNLRVFDSYSGKDMAVEDISGGETFITSLALALGLADVATSRTGGLSLDAIFIDEGFGALDEETLELAMKTLMEMEGEQRLIGLISHVAEMKAMNIPKIEVIKGREGSTLKY